MNPAEDRYAALRHPEFRFIILSRIFATLANRAQVVIFGWQIYELTNDPLYLGYLGLTEAIPALSVALFAGHMADRMDRRRIVLCSEIVAMLGALTLALISTQDKSFQVPAIYIIVFITGIARGFADPAFQAFEAQILPRSLYINGSAWASSIWQTCAIVGPAMGGFIFAQIGSTYTYSLAAILLFGSVLSLLKTNSRPVPPSDPEESIWTSLSEGVRFVVRDQPLVGSMTLDLIAVFFGGVIALLPVFAKRLGVGPFELGLMSAAPSIGAVIVMVIATKHAPMKNAGKVLMLCVAGFGLCMLTFAWSQIFLITLLALILSGVFDGMSMVIRRAIVQLRSPEHMRGRVASVNGIFIGASNELGAMESGIAARLMGVIPSIYFGGVLTLVTVTIVALTMPKLRNLDLTKDMKRLQSEDA